MFAGEGQTLISNIETPRLPIQEDRKAMSLLISCHPYNLSSEKLLVLESGIYQSWMNSTIDDSVRSI